MLEVFGEHTLSGFWIVCMLAASVVLLGPYWKRASKLQDPLLRLSLFGTRTFRGAVAAALSRGLRLAVCRSSSLSSIFYQVGLGTGGVASCLLVMPQLLAAMTLKVVLPQILNRLGYRRLLVSNTIAIGVNIMQFSLIREETPGEVIGGMGFVLGFFSSLQFTSMNILVFPDVSQTEASKASSLSSTMQ